VRHFRRRETLNEQLLREAEADAARTQAPGTANLDSESGDPSLEPGGRVGLRRWAQFKRVDPELEKSREWQDWWTRWGRRDLRRILIEEWGSTEAETGAEYEEDLDALGVQLRDGAWPESVASYLNEAEEKRTGTSPTTASRARNRALAGRLRTWHDKETGGQLDDSIWRDLLGGLAALAGWFSDFFLRV
jgi:hypothetical protein